MAYNVYSLPDVKAVLYHPDVGQANLHSCGVGKITVSHAGDYTSHTTTADGYVVVNRLRSTNGTITIEVPQNSIGDWFMRRRASWDADHYGSLRGIHDLRHRDIPAEGAGRTEIPRGRTRRVYQDSGAEEYIKSCRILPQ